ncbi:MAG: hypothetical protein FWG66_08750 [Spirochaetes bacterium]|nr:hypothetical protein [Spirochaetota bacterium]
MKRYSIKTSNGKAEFIDILKEIEGGFFVRITRLSDGGEKVSEEIISRQLFETCLRTGQLTEVAASMPAADDEAAAEAEAEEVAIHASSVA